MWSGNNGNFDGASSFTEATRIITAYLRLIQERKSTVHLRIAPLIVGCVRFGTPRSCEVHLRWQEFVFCLYFMTRDFYIQHVSVVFKWGLSNGVPLNLLFKESGHWYRKGLEFNNASRQIIWRVWSTQSFMNCSFYSALESRALEASLNNRLTKVRFTAITFPTELDFVTCPAAAKNGTMIPSTRARRLSN